MILSMQTLLMIFAFNSLIGQGTSIPFVENFTEKYSECAAIVYNDQMLVESYSPEATCELDASKKGKIGLSTVLLSEDETVVKTSLPFRWAIKNRKTGTIYSVDSKAIESIDVSEMLKHCGNRDSIIIMTVDPTYSVPHNEIIIKGGC